jgi:Fe-S-cluster containining protein
MHPLISHSQTAMQKLPPDTWHKHALAQQKNYKKFLLRANKRDFLKALPEAHEAAVAQIDCMSCAACCKNYSPRFKAPDIKRISKGLGQRESAFIAQYLRMDEEGDYVVKSTPCPFLGSDNACSIYEMRPTDCQRFPYTDEDVLLKRPNITLKNSTFCPITYVVMEQLLAELG